MDSEFLSVVLGILLSISEILPFIKSIQGNGIINVLQSFITKQQQLNSFEQMETAPLLQEPSQVISSAIKDLSNCISNSTNLVLTKVNQNKFTLKTPDEYQLINIENTLINNFSKRLEFKDISDNNCEILRSLGYKIDYNANEETYLVHW